MALFKKKSSDAAAPPATAPDTATGGDASSATVLDDFSDFSPDALAGAADTNGAANGNGKKGKRAKAPKAEKKSMARGALKAGVYIGLNVGTDTIKVVELTAKGSELAITGMGMVPTPPDSISNGVVMSVSALSSAIKDAMAQAGIKSKRVVTSVSGTGALVVRIIEVPKMSDGELEDNMKMDADRYIPFPPSEVIMDFKALRDLPSDPDAMNMEVLLAAAQREIIDLHVQVLQDAKLDPRAIDVEPLSAARALTHPITEGSDPNAEADYGDVAAILNIGASATEISILRGDILVFTRTVPTAGNSLTQGIVDTLGLAWHDAQDLKHEMGDALAPGAGVPAAVVAPVAFDAGGFDASDAGNDDWTEFGLDDAAGDESALGAQPDDSFADAGETATTEPAATDPFDDAFFEQGPQGDLPRQNEPGEQHMQKEPGTDNDPEARDLPSRAGEVVPPEGVAGSINFADSEEEGALPSRQTAVPQAASSSAAPAPAPAQSTPAASSPTSNDDLDLAALFRFDEIDDPDEDLPTAEDGKPLDINSLLGIEEDDFSDLPTLSTEGAATPPPSLPSAFDFPIDELPTRESTPANTASLQDVSDTNLPGRTGRPAGTEGIQGSTNIDAEEASLLPTGAPTESAFAFADDIFGPSATPTPTPAPAEPLDFSFGAPEEAAAETPIDPLTPAPATPSADDPFAAFDLTGGAPATPAAPAPTPEVAAPAATAAADDFDLDSLFAGTPAETPVTAAAPPAAVEPDFLGDDILGDAAFGDAALGSDVFAGDAFGDDFASFGAGLAGAAPSDIDAQTLYGILSPVLDSLVAEVRRSLEYHTTRYPDAAVRRITLIGGGAKLTNIDAYFTQSLGIPTTVGNAAARLPLRAAKVPPDYVDQNGPLFTVAIGLAMRELVR